MSMLKVSYKFHGKTLPELRDALIAIIDERRELVPSDQGTRVVNARCDGEREAFNQVLDILRALEFEPWA